MEQPEAGPDLLGRTSARLLAAGIDRRDRLDALKLLAILDASIDASGRVRRPLDDLAGEFELSPLSVLGSLDHLERVGAVRREGSHVCILDAEPGRVGGMQLAAFLDDLRASFDGARAPARSTWLVRRGGSLVASMTALAVLAVLTFTPTGAPRPVALRDAPTATASAQVDPRVRGASTTRLGTTTDPTPSSRFARAERSVLTPFDAPAADDDVFAAEASVCHSDAVPRDLVSCLLHDGLVIIGSAVGGVTLQPRDPNTGLDDTTSVPVTGGLPPMVVEIERAEAPNQTVSRAIRL